MVDRRSRHNLVYPGSDRRSGPRTYETGAIIPVTGIYLVMHFAHRLPHEVIAIKGHRFPKCQKCSDAVRFELLHRAADLFQHVTEVVYELPEIEDAGSVA